MGTTFQNLFLLAESKDGFELQKRLQVILEQEHIAPVQIVETDLEEL
ncbi:hypothetical protein ACT7C1_11555 [Bacillus paranthracis]